MWSLCRLWSLALKKKLFFDVLFSQCIAWTGNSSGRGERRSPLLGQLSSVFKLVEWLFLLCHELKTPPTRASSWTRTNSPPFLSAIPTLATLGRPVSVWLHIVSSPNRESEFESDQRSVCFLVVSPFLSRGGEEEECRYRYLTGSQTLRFVCWFSTASSSYYRNCPRHAIDDAQTSGESEDEFSKACFSSMFRWLLTPPWALCFLPFQGQLESFHVFVKTSNKILSDLN